MLYAGNSSGMMNIYKYYLNKLQIAIYSVLLLLFMILSANIVLPLKWRFPAWKLSPHLSTMKLDTAEGIRTDYIGSNDKITVALDKNYATIVRTLDQNGNCVLEQYFDNYGRPAVTAYGDHALSREYNSDRKWITSTYLDSRLRPFNGRRGYASIHRTYNAIGKVETEMYFGADGLPALCLTKVYGMRREYDENGQVSAVTNLDADGNAMNNVDHYAVNRRVYDSNGELYMETYYDTNGNPVRLSSGQYGYIYVNGKRFCIDQNGRRMFALRYFLLHNIFAVLLIGVLLLALILLSDRALTWILLFLYLGFITYMTIMNRDTGIGIVTWNIPPNYYLFFADREILSNIWLFIPFGAILNKLSHMWEMIAFPIALSLLIETSQLILDIGAFELSDLIANSLGGAVGIMVCYLLEPLAISIWNKRTPPG